MKLYDRFCRFMYGRYGVDAFYKFLFVIDLLLLITAIFTRGIIRWIFYGVAFLCFAFMFFRIFSRNIEARKRENAVYLRIVGAVASFFRLQKCRFRDRKTHVFRKCPACHAVLRFPKVKGKHGAVCPQCGNHFEVHIHFKGKSEKKKKH